MEKILKGTYVLSRGIAISFLVLSFVLATAIGAYVYISLPFTPVPITLQTFFVLLCGIVLRNYGGLSQILYVALGVIGLPVFAQGAAGLSRIFGPTGGYLISFILTAIFIGQFYHVRKYLQGLGVLLLGTLIIYTFGSFQLWLYSKVSVDKILLMGVAPFLPGDLIKLLVVHQIGYWVRKKRWLDLSC